METDEADMNIAKGWRDALGFARRGERGEDVEKKPGPPMNADERR
jgi:hypothetical protein